MGGNGGHGDRGGSAKGPNAQLSSWFARSGWSKGELARQVNRRARQLGAHHISTDTSRVRRWLDGEQPREPIPRILSELFSERFGCVVAVEDMGLRPSYPSLAGASVDLPWTGHHTVMLMSEFSRSDLMLARRGFLGTSLGLSAGPGLVEPMQRWLAPAQAPGPDRQHTEARRPPRRGARLSLPEVELLESAVVMFRAWDAQCGGGLRRKAVVGQLHEVTDLLREPQSEEVATRLFRVAAELAALAGWMSYDIGLQPIAQKYFVLALHAAKEADDRPLGSYVLATMSRQMIHLGRPDDGLELIHLAQYGSRDSATPRTQAMLYAMEARAYANLGQPSRCIRAARIAEDTFAECSLGAASPGAASPGAASPGEPEPDWIGFFSEAELNAENAHSFRDLAYVAGRSPLYAEQARPVMQRAVDLFAKEAEQGGVHQRSYALNLIGMASVHLLRGEPEQAAESASLALPLAGRIRSERVNTRLRKTVDTAVREFGHVPQVAELGERLAAQLPDAPPAREAHPARPAAPEVARAV
ncbi:hypothetical protein RKE29_25760 [Streptomyces sp. B1866]|uniref:transcriptional repressor NsdA n=1 Tax=Streptomyces sp. B1866 TaxID=3075431 RepID=UPI00288FF03C|nr:hypothetical protein [Streptomyces sp. B1866]MDT3399993.1 hypothetical protein [Streptomyces sp. B1866]